MQAGTHTDKHANSEIRPHGVDIPWYYVMKNAPANQSYLGRSYNHSYCINSNISSLPLSLLSY